MYFYTDKSHTDDTEKIQLLTSATGIPRPRE